MSNYQQSIARYYNSKFHPQTPNELDLVLHKVFQNTTEPNTGKLGANWEGPYKVLKIRLSVYHLKTLDSTEVHHS